MKDILNTIFLFYARIRLSEDEKLNMKQRLIEEMHANPVRNARWGGLYNQSNKLTFIQLIRIKYMPIVAIIVLLLGAMGGTSALAERALPGDLLYPVKISVNERVLDLLAVSANAQAQTDGNIAMRRLQEAEQLATQSRLASTTLEQLTQNFEEHANRVQDRIKTFEARDAQHALEVASDFNASLKAHQRILAAIAANQDATTTNRIADLLRVVKHEQGDTQNEENQSSNSVKKDTSPDMKTAVEGKMNAVNHKIDEVASFITQKGSVLSAADLAQAQARLQDARDLVAQGKQKLNAGAYGEAFAIFQEASAKAQEAKLLVNAKAEFDTRAKDNDHGLNATSTPEFTATSTPDFRRNDRGEKEQNKQENQSGSQRQNEIHIDLGD